MQLSHRADTFGEVNHGAEVDSELVATFERTYRQYTSSAQALVPLAERLALAQVAEVLPGTSRLEVFGHLTEDWIAVLRIQRILSNRGEILFDIAFGHPDRRVEETVDVVNSEYLDLLIDLTGDEFMGHRTID
jgi:hypothetical protein